MDPITHMLAGALVNQSTAKKDFIKQATWIGALSAAAPDLDFFVHSSLNPLLNLEIHRSFTHSLIFIFIGGLIMTGFFLLLFKSWRPRWKEIWGLSTLAYSTHSLLDACTSYGTQLFWPFSHQRISWDILSIIDPVFSIIFLVGAILAYLFRSVNIARWAILLIFCYIGFANIQHHRAMNTQVDLHAARQHTKTTQNRVLPQFMSLYHWDSLYIYRGTVYLDTIHTPLGKPAHTEKNFSLPLFTPTALYVQPNYQDTVNSFIWFTQDYSAALSYAPLVLVDLRYILKQPKPTALWGIEWNVDPSKKSPLMTRLTSVFILSQEKKRQS